jgi:5'-deoxynucleotidase YfbR-like HD superfamily hydrolase
VHVSARSAWHAMPCPPRPCRTSTHSLPPPLSPACRPAAAEISELWHEYEAGASPEAALIKDIDKLEMVVQAAEYEGVAAAGGGGPHSLQEFFDSTDGKWRTDIG